MAHVVSQASQVFVVPFSNRVALTQANGHVVPSRYLPVSQEEHKLLAAPVQVLHSA